MVLPVSSMDMPSDPLQRMLNACAEFLASEADHRYFESIARKRREKYGQNISPDDVTGTKHDVFNWVMGNPQRFATKVEERRTKLIEAGKSPENEAKLVQQVTGFVFNDLLRNLQRRRAKALEVTSIEETGTAQLPVSVVNVQRLSEVMDEFHELIAQKTKDDKSKEVLQQILSKKMLDLNILQNEIARDLRLSESTLSKRMKQLKEMLNERWKKRKKKDARS